MFQDHILNGHYTFERSDLFCCTCCICSEMQETFSWSVTCFHNSYAVQDFPLVQIVGFVENVIVEESLERFHNLPVPLILVVPNAFSAVVVPTVVHSSAIGAGV